MIELTEQQCQELNGSDSLAVNPRTNEKYVLVHYCPVISQTMTTVYGDRRSFPGFFEAKAPQKWRL